MPSVIGTFMEAGASGALIAGIEFGILPAPFFWKRKHLLRLGHGVHGRRSVKAVDLARVKSQLLQTRLQRGNCFAAGETPESVRVSRLVQPFVVCKSRINRISRRNHQIAKIVVARFAFVNPAERADFAVQRNPFGILRQKANAACGSRDSRARRCPPERPVRSSREAYSQE